MARFHDKMSEPPYMINGWYDDILDRAPGCRAQCPLDPPLDDDLLHVNQEQPDFPSPPVEPAELPERPAGPAVVPPPSVLDEADFVLPDDASEDEVEVCLSHFISLL